MAVSGCCKRSSVDRMLLYCSLLMSKSSRRSLGWRSGNDIETCGLLLVLLLLLPLLLLLTDVLRRCVLVAVVTGALSNCGVLPWKRSGTRCRCCTSFPASSRADLPKSTSTWRHIRTEYSDSAAPSDATSCLSYRLLS